MNIFRIFETICSQKPFEIVDIYSPYEHITTLAGIKTNDTANNERI